MTDKIESSSTFQALEEKAGNLIHGVVDHLKNNAATVLDRHASVEDRLKAAAFLTVEAAAVVAIAKVGKAGFSAISGSVKGEIATADEFYAARQAAHAARVEEQELAFRHDLRQIGGFASKSEIPDGTKVFQFDSHFIPPDRLDKFAELATKPKFRMDNGTNVRIGDGYRANTHELADMFLGDAKSATWYSEYDRGLEYSSHPGESFGLSRHQTTLATWKSLQRSDDPASVHRYLNSFADRLSRELAEAKTNPKQPWYERLQKAQQAPES